MAEKDLTVDTAQAIMEVLQQIRQESAEYQKEQLEHQDELYRRKNALEKDAHTQASEEDKALERQRLRAIDARSEKEIKKIHEQTEAEIAKKQGYSVKEWDELGKTDPKKQQALRANEEKLLKDEETKTQKAQQNAEKRKRDEKAGKFSSTGLASGNADAMARDIGHNLSVLVKSFGRVKKVDADGNPITDENGKEKTAWGKTIIGGIANLTKSVVDGIAGLAKQLSTQIDTIASMKGNIDTRLQGSKNKTKSSWQGESYWDQMSSDTISLAAVSPYFKQETLNNKISDLVGKGIAFDVEQRAFLLTISDKVATTFSQTSSSLNKLIRIQQQDSTAARLGMESALTQFLNNMYETTEYMSDIMSSINASLYEAEALMTTQDATAFEYQVNKWMGSMYSVGMSESGVNAISGALSKLAAGQLEGLTGSSTGNLLVMAANEAGLSISDLLANGLNDETTNELMEAMVDYLAKIYNQAGDSKVIQQQVASIYGLTASDLKAMLNLTDDGTTMKSISNSYLSYNSAMDQLNTMVNTMYQRTSIGEMVNNVASNATYTLSASIANSPAMYAMYKIASLSQDLFGGIDVPDVSVVGTGAALGTSISNLLMAGALGGGLLSNIGSIVSGISNSFDMSSALSQLGISGSNMQTVSRGTGTGGLITTGGRTKSASTAMYSDEGDGAYTKAMSSANQQTSEAVAGAKDEEDQDVTNKVLDEHIVAISDLLTEVVDGGKSFHVVFDENMSFSS